MKIPRRRILLIGLAMLLGTVGIGAWRLHYRPKYALAAYKQQIIAAGEKLTIAEVVPALVPEEENSTAAFLKTTSLLNNPQTLLDTNPPPAMRMILPGKAMVGWQQPDLRDFYEAKITNTWAEAEQALGDIAEGLALLHQLIEKPRLDFRLDYQQGYSLMLPNLAPAKRAAQRLSAAVVCDLRHHDTAAAVKNIRALLGLTKGMRDERLLISQLVRIAIASITWSANWELLQAKELTDAQLASLQQDWTELEFVPGLEHALEMERAMGELTVAQMRSSSASFQRIALGVGPSGSSANPSSGDWFSDAGEFAKETWEKTRVKTKETVWRVAWSYPDQLRKLQGDQALLETARFVQTNGTFDAALRRQKARLAEIGIERPGDDDARRIDADEQDFRTMLSQSVLALHGSLRRVMNIEISRQLIITAIALKRYQLRHGEYPAELAALMPEFLSALPRDPVDGKPLRYRPESTKAFLLYSVGEDAQDAGGDPRPADEKTKSLTLQRARDWVWPQPASAEEVAAAYAQVVKEHLPIIKPGTIPTLTAEQERAFRERYGAPGSSNPPTNAASTNTVP